MFMAHTKMKEKGTTISQMVDSQLQMSNPSTQTLKNKQKLSGSTFFTTLENSQRFTATK